MARGYTLHIAGFGVSAQLAEFALGHATARASFGVLQPSLGAATAIIGLRAARSWTAALAVGLAVYLVTLYMGYWTSISHLGGVVPILCWELDELAGLGQRRVCLPRNPIGRLDARTDQRSTPAAQPPSLLMPGGN